MAGRRAAWWETDSRRLRWAGLLLYVAVVAVWSAYAQIRPVNNWDMLAYVGIARSIEITDTDELHADVYDRLERSVPISDYEALTGSGEEPTTSRSFFVATSTSPQAFSEQLPFYLVKPVYPMLIAAGATLGADPFDASVVIATLGYVAFAALLAVWLGRHHPPLIAYGLAGVLFLSPPFSILARLSTPDSLSLLVVVASAFVLVELRRPRLALAIALLAVPIRPNNAAWAVLLGIYLMAWAPAAIRPSRWIAGAAPVVAVAAYLGLTWWAGYYPFSTLFYHATIEYLGFPAGFESPLTLLDYPRQYVHELLAFQYGAALLFVFLALATLLARRWLGGPRHDAMSGVVVVALAAAAGQWLAYPIEPERILVSQLAIIAIALACSVGLAARAQSMGVGSP